MNSRFLIVVLFAFFSLSLNAEDEGKKFLHMANTHYEAGHYDLAVKYYFKAAEFDEVEAMFNLGYAFYHGEGISQDFPSAVMWFKRAASMQYPKAEYNLAFCYMNGKGVPCNYDKALELLVASANHGFHQAQLTLSECYERGVLVEQNLDMSKKWKTLAEEKTASAPPSFDVEINGELHERSQVSNKNDKEKENRSPITVYGPGCQPSYKSPVLKILFPKDQSFFHTDQIKVKYQLLADDLEDSTTVVAMVDAVTINNSGTRAVRQANTIEVDVPNHDCTVTLFAKNKAGNSEPVSIRLIRENIAQGDLPRLFCVAIGVGDYHDDKLPPLKLSTKDARDFANAIAKKRGLPFADVQVKLLTDKEATRADIFEALEWLQQETTPNDISFFYYAGHGYCDEKDRFFFMPYGGTTDKLYNCFSAADFKNMAEDIHCKLIVFADACYSAALLEGNRSAATIHFVEQLRRTKNGMMLYASSASNTKSKEDPSWGNGAFTKALLSAFNGGARQQFDEGLSTQELDRYLYKEVRRLTNFKQTPIFINPNGMEHFNIFTYAE